MEQGQSLTTLPAYGSPGPPCLPSVREDAPINLQRFDVPGLGDTQRELHSLRGQGWRGGCKEDCGRGDGEDSELDIK